MRRALLVALGSSAIAAAVLYLLPGPEGMPDDLPPLPRSEPPLDWKAGVDDVDVQWKASFREALAGVAPQPEEDEASAPRTGRRVATVEPAPEAEEPLPLPPNPPPEAAPPAATTAAIAAQPRAPPRPTLDKESVKKAVSWMETDIAGCFQEGMKQDRELDGTVWVRFTIDVNKNEGTIRDARLDAESSTMKQAAVQTCILRALSKAQFPVPGVDGARVNVRYPFTLKKRSSTPF